MNLLQQLKIGPRLSLGFGVVLLLLIGMSAVALSRLAHIGAATGALVGRDWVKAEAASRIDALTRANARRTMELFVASDREHADRVHQAISRNKAAITQALQTLDSLIDNPQGKALLATVKDSRIRYVASFTRVDELLAASRRDEATRELLDATLPAIDTLQTHVAALAEFQKKVAATRGAEVEQDIQATRTLLLACAGAAVLIAAACGWLIMRSITQPIGQALRIADAVAAGDLGSRIEVRGRDEPAQLLAALKAMNDSLLRTVGAVRQGSESIATASSQIASGNADLSQRTEEQASNLQQTAASMEQLTGTVNNNAEAARVASQIAGQATDAARHGSEVVGRVQATMSEISASSRRIGDILGMIDEIAFQTNLLALNASVEAARAGAHGRGFSVVAGEVRSLAQRCANAAHEIKSLIVDSEEKVHAGGALAAEAGRAMDEIDVRVRRVSDLIDEISTATTEQNTGIAQVGCAVSQLDQVTQQNAALVEESAAAAQSLSHQAANLVLAVSAFRCPPVALPA